MENLNELALFAGAGGGILGGHLLGWHTVCAVECNPYAASVLMARQNDGCLPPFPIWDDVRTFDGRPWRGRVDVVSGGFPCQDISSAGKGAGITGARSGLWAEMARIIGEVGPRFVLVENSPLLTGRGLHVVLGDLASLGFDARWGVLGAVDAGAPHKRERIWILAHAEQDGRAGGGINERSRPMDGAVVGESRMLHPTPTTSANCCADVAASRDAGQGIVPDSDGSGRVQWSGSHVFVPGRAEPTDGNWWTLEPDVGRVAHGVAARVDRLAAIGNGQVPAVVRLAWSRLGL